MLDKNSGERGAGSRERNWGGLQWAGPVPPHHANTGRAGAPGCGSILSGPSGVGVGGESRGIPHLPKTGQMWGTPLGRLNALKGPDGRIAVGTNRETVSIAGPRFARHTLAVSALQCLPLDCDAALLQVSRGLQYLLLQQGWLIVDRLQQFPDVTLRHLG